MVQLFGAILNDVTLSLRKTFCLVLRCFGRFKLYYFASCFAVCWKVQALLFCIVLRCLLEGSSFIAVLSVSYFVMLLKNFVGVFLSKSEESVCHFWTLYINQNVFCFERFAMFDRTDPLWSQIKSAK